MNIWSKLLTALRGGVNETGEKLIDSQALRILDQELRDASSELQEAKQSLVEIMAHQKTAEARVVELRVKIREYEDYALQALEKQEADLARDVAEKIAALEIQCGEQDRLAADYRQSAQALRSNIQETEQNLRRMRQQADTVKATESVQQAQKMVAERFGGSQSRLHSAMESLERIQEKQIHQAAKFSATSELAASNSETTLDQKLKTAGITPSGNDADAVLARLKAAKLKNESKD